MGTKRYRLIAADGGEVLSDAPGLLGGHRGTKIYGRLDCPAARRALAWGDSYRRRRVFFADEPTAVAAGFRPCARCMPAAYAVWKARRNQCGGLNARVRGQPS
jgi:Metal binding domain of Ada